MCYQGDQPERYRFFFELLNRGTRWKRCLNLRFQSPKVNICITWENLDGCKYFRQELSTNRKVSWPRETALNASVRAAKHSAFLTAPDRHFTTARARELYCTLTRENHTRTPRAGGHADNLLAGYRSCRTHSLALQFSHTHGPEGYKLIAGFNSSPSRRFIPPNDCRDRQIQTAARRISS